jgi:aerobic-type carbon monoxide dehydrogenase small subunit (CoxS/CutS family)
MVTSTKEPMSGNICRCGAYPNIVTAIQQALRRGIQVCPPGISCFWR